MTEPVLRLPFSRLDRQRQADRLGMLLFLATEVLLFGGVFAAAMVIRLRDPAGYAAASRDMHYWLGGANTAVLLTSSLCVALAVAMARQGRARACGWWLGGAIVLAVVFLGAKGAEYAIEWRDGVVPVFSAAQLRGGFHTLFMTLYFTATALHALHVAVGIGLLGSLLAPFGAARHDRGATTIGNLALYWHFVDVVWIFLYPTLYLAR